METQQRTGLANDDLQALERSWAQPRGFVGWLSLVNHRAVGKRYIVTGFIFFILAGLDALRMRLQLAVPEAGIIEAGTYSAAFTMHGTTMMFLFALPILEGVGIYLVPLMIGARDMALPRLNAFGYWVYLIAGVTLYAAYIFGAPPTGGWFAYPPLTRREFSADLGLDFWATMITFIEVAALVAAVELIVTILKLRAPGMSLARMPIFVWAVLVMSFMIVFAMPPLMVTSMMLALDRGFGAQFFNPLAGGEPLLWQHLFWFFGHPDVYILMIPSFGMLTAIFITAARRPLVGYTAVVLSLVAIGFISFGLWVHHMFATGLPLLGMNFFTAASMMVAVPGAVQLACWIATIWNGRLVVNTAFLFAAGALITFVLGGVTGVMLASVPLDLQVHDTFFVVAHFHYVLFGGVVFPLFAGFHHWFPKVTGRMLGEKLGRWSFALMFTGFHIAFFPQHFLGVMGMPRRVFTYVDGLGWGGLNLLSTAGAFVIAIGVLLFIVNAVAAPRRRDGSADDPWNADSLEWSTSSPPPNYNFQQVPTVRGRYARWSAEGAEQPVIELRSDRREAVVTDVVDARPQGRTVLPGPTLVPLYAALAVAFAFLGLIAHPLLVLTGAILTFLMIVVWNWPEDRSAPDPGDMGDERVLRERAGQPGVLRTAVLPALLTGSRAPLWWAVMLLVVIESTVFGSLFASYLYIRSGAATWPPPGFDVPDLLLPGINTVVLLSSAGAVYWGTLGIRRGDQRQLKLGLGIGLVLEVVFLSIKIVESLDFGHGWSAHAYGSIYWSTSGLHTLHVIVAILMVSVALVLALRNYYTPERWLGLQVISIYWQFVAIIWLPLLVVLYFVPRWL